MGKYCHTPSPKNGGIKFLCAGKKATTANNGNVPIKHSTCAEAELRAQKNKYEGMRVFVGLADGDGPSGSDGLLLGKTLDAGDNSALDVYGNTERPWFTWRKAEGESAVGDRVTLEWTSVSHGMVAQVAEIRIDYGAIGGAYSAADVGGVQCQDGDVRISQDSVLAAGFLGEEDDLVLEIRTLYSTEETNDQLVSSVEYL